MSKNSHLIKIYSLVTQGISCVLVLGAIGFGIGYLINKNGILPGILAFVGVIIGIVIFIQLLWRLGGEIDGPDA